MRAVGYRRVSSKNQVGGWERQDSEIRKYAEKNRLDLAYMTGDFGRSGYKEKRIGLEEALELIKRDDIGALIVESRDRLSREGIEELRKIEALISDAGCVLLVIEKPSPEFVASVMELMVQVCRQPSWVESLPEAEFALLYQACVNRAEGKTT